MTRGAGHARPRPYTATAACEGSAVLPAFRAASALRLFSGESRLFHAGSGRGHGNGRTIELARDQGVRYPWYVVEVDNSPMNMDQSATMKKVVIAPAVEMAM